MGVSARADSLSFINPLESSIMLHTVTLESTHGREIATARNVPDAELVACFRKFALSREAQACAIPIVFVDGRGYTSIPEFMERVVHPANAYSTYHGGTAIY